MDDSNSKRWLSFLENTPSLPDLGVKVDQWHYRCCHCEYSVKILSGTNPYGRIYDSLLRHWTETHPKSLNYIKADARSRAVLSELGALPND